ncbi:conserved membrane hypothetical protein [Thiomonas sp. X19]|uniref:DUF4337 domain-containing protein n=1 Tax=Thiomonas sp. X19 TaxID=1050370 RepID=UPI000B6EEF19|nr:DUF4337 domain-containing protein [Thiomonas sp. X19]SCC93087.1 conserved membrane hypothetical protein [Thiomonas sp. X19]
MSESGVHAHAPHEEAVHHASEGKNHTLNQWVAIFTALLAALGAIVSYQGSHLMNEVLLYKNEAVLKKTHATDEWNYYQAVSTKQHLMELAHDLAPADKQAGIVAKITKYQGQKTEIKARADALEAASNKANEESDRLNRPHTGMARSLIFLQIAISLASITALTGRRWLFGVAMLSALIGVGLWVTALGWVAA